MLNEGEIDYKEAIDALCMLLGCELKDKEFETQREQFKIVNGYIEKLQKENELLKTERDYYKQRYIEFNGAFLNEKQSD